MTQPKIVKRRVYNPEIDGNRFAWILEECERIRHHARRSVEAPPKPHAVSLRTHPGNAILLKNLQEPRPHQPRENIFEFAKARKL